MSSKRLGDWNKCFTAMFEDQIHINIFFFIIFPHWSITIFETLNGRQGHIYPVYQYHNCWCRTLRGHQPPWYWQRNSGIFHTQHTVFDSRRFYTLFSLWVISLIHSLFHRKTSFWEHSIKCGQMYVFVDILWSSRTHNIVAMMWWFDHKTYKRELNLLTRVFESIILIKCL